jgi:hypothetical protein
VPASDYRALQSQVRELQRLLGNKTLEAEILKEALVTPLCVPAGKRNSTAGRVIVNRVIVNRSD